MKIRKKTWPDYFQAFLDGKKTFDARLANFECKTGDTLIFEEYNPKTKKYTGRKIEKKISFVLNTKRQKFWSQSDIQKQGLLIIAFK